MELRQIESFVAVAEELHFGRAARRIHLSQPALSQQIKRLEAELGFELLSRTQRKVELTAAGASFLANARQLLRDAERMVDEATRAANGQSGSLRLGYVGSSLFSVVPAITRSLRARAPGLDLSLVEMKSELQMAEMRADRMDAGFVKAPARPVPDFTIRPVYTEGVGLAVADRHRLAGATSVALGRVADEPFVIFPRSAEPDTFDLLMRFCAAHGFAPTIAQEALSLQTVLGLVATGLGVAFVADSVMDTSARAGVSYVRLEPPTPTLTTAVAWPSDGTNPAVALLAEAIDEVLPDRARAGATVTRSGRPGRNGSAGAGPGQPTGHEHPEAGAHEQPDEHGRDRRETSIHTGRAEDDEHQERNDDPADDGAGDHLAPHDLGRPAEGFVRRMR